MPATAPTAAVSVTAPAGWTGAQSLAEGHDGARSAKATGCQSCPYVHQKFDRSNIDRDTLSLRLAELIGDYAPASPSDLIITIRKWVPRIGIDW